MTKRTHLIAYDYAMSMKIQRVNEQMIHEALVTLCGDNQVHSLSEPIEAGYTKLVQEVVGEDLFDWLQWWMYETNYGTLDMEFSVDCGKTMINPTEMTLFRFMEIVDEKDDSN